MQTSKPIILVTGSSGLIGSAVCRMLADDYRLFGLDVKPPADPNPPAQHIALDLADDQKVIDALARIRSSAGDAIASVVHLAAYYDFSGEPSDLYEKITLRGSERLLRALRLFRVEQFIFSSTMLVHAPAAPGRPIDEETPLEPKWDYPMSKVKAEQLILAQRGDTPVILLRIAGVYDDVGHSIPIVQQARRIHERQLTSHLFPGDTSHGQSFIHLNDLVEAIRLCVQRRSELPPETILLIGEPSTPSYDDLQRAFARELHGETEWETRRIPKELAKAGAWVQGHLPTGEEPFIKPWMIDLADDHYELDITRARRLLGWQPRHTLLGTIPRIAAALKRDPAAWYKEHKISK